MRATADRQRALFEQLRVGEVVSFLSSGAAVDERAGRAGQRAEKLGSPTPATSASCSIGAVDHKEAEEAPSTWDLPAPAQSVVEGGQERRDDGEKEPGDDRRGIDDLFRLSLSDLLP